MAGFGDYCVLVTSANNDEVTGKYDLLLCNTLGTVVDGKIIQGQSILYLCDS